MFFELNNAKDILIFAHTQNSGIKKLSELVGRLKFNDVLRIVSSKNHSFAELKDGTMYRVLLPLDNCRGYKGRKAYVQYGISEEIINEVIKSLLCFSDLPVDERIEFF